MKLLQALLLHGRSRIRRTAAAIALGVVMAATCAVIVVKFRPEPIREALRSELALREGALYLYDVPRPFSGILVEDFAPGKRKLAIAIRHGKAHGLSRGWFENGQQEVQESFVNGVSHGTRTRWFENGSRKSEEQIEQGKLVGSYVEWHDNGQKAVAMTLVDGKPHGIAEAWHRSGKLKSRTRMDHGKLMEREFFEDSLASATPTSR